VCSPQLHEAPRFLELLQPSFSYQKTQTITL